MNAVRADRSFYSTCVLALGNSIGNLVGPYKNTTDKNQLALVAGMPYTALISSYERVFIIFICYTYLFRRASKYRLIISYNYEQY